MAIETSTLHEIAAKYIAAEDGRTPIEPVSLTYPDLSGDEAYQVQKAIVSNKIQRGESVIGMKVGATNPAIQKALGVDEPIYGRLFQSSRVGDGATISLAQLIHPRIECEIAFLLAKDLVGPGITETEVLDATQAVIASLEINDPRTREWKIGKCELIADNGIVARFVLGERGIPVGNLDLAKIGVVMKKNGEVVAASTGAAVLGHPARAVAWLANTLYRTHQRLAAGVIILPGSLTAMQPVAAGDWFEAEFEELGSVSIRFAG